MFAIEIDGERFEGKDEAEAKRRVRKAHHEQRRVERAESKARDIARGRAEAAGYRVLCRLAVPGLLPPGWSVRGPDDKYSTHRVVLESGGPVSRIETEHGFGEWQWAFDDSSKILGSLEAGNGYCLAVFLACEDGTAYAVGVAEIEGTDRTVVALADLPNVTMANVQALAVIR